MKPKLYNRPWEDWELAILDEGAKTGMSWAEIAAKTGRRTALSCSKKSKKLRLKGRLIFWAKIEDETVRKHYPALGWKGVIRHWPKGYDERSEKAIYRRAKTLGLTKKREMDSGMERVIREAYRDGQLYPVKRAAAALGVPIGRVQYMARVLGLSCRPQPNRRWTEFEIAMLEKSPHLSAVVMSKKLKRAGYNRTPTAIVQYRNKTGTGGIGDFMLPAEVGKLLGGFAQNAVLRWIKAGWLEATNRGYQKAGDHHLISRRALRDFVAAHPERIRLHWADIDPTWFVSMLCDTDSEPKKKAVAR